MRASPSASVRCWLDLDPDGDRPGWRSPWARGAWWALGLLVILSVIRFLTNPLICAENLTIVLVLGLLLANARRLRLLLAPPSKPRPAARAGSIHRAARRRS